MGSLVKKMMKGWNFDETPKQVQILAQLAQKLNQIYLVLLAVPRKI